MDIVCFNLSAISLIAQIPTVKNDLEGILPFGDDLSFGPISDVTGTERKNWNSWLLKSRYNFSTQEIEQSWAGNIRRWEFVKTRPAKFQVWLTRNSPAELCGFAEFLCNIPDGREFEIVDFTTAQDIFPSMDEDAILRSIGHLSLANLHRGVGRVKKSVTEEWLVLTTQWRSLRTSGEAMRVAKDMIPVSLPETHFDRRLLASLMPHWKPTAKLLFELLFELEDEAISVSCDLLEWRLLEFAKSGIVEFQASEDSPLEKVRLRLNVA